MAEPPDVQPLSYRTPDVQYEPVTAFRVVVACLAGSMALLTLAIAVAVIVMGVRVGLGYEPINNDTPGARTAAAIACVISSGSILMATLIMWNITRRQFNRRRIEPAADER